MNQSEIDGNLTDLVRQASDMIYQSNTYMGARMNALGEEKRMANSAQINAASDLHEFLVQYREDQKAQAKENRVNRWLTVASLIVAAVSMATAIISLIH